MLRKSYQQPSSQRLRKRRSPEATGCRSASGYRASDARRRAEVVNLKRWKRRLSVAAPVENYRPDRRKRGNEAPVTEAAPAEPVSRAPVSKS